MLTVFLIKIQKHILIGFNYEDSWDSKRKSKKAKLTYHNRTLGG
jgi:hypothetical protein